jgi:hypothetical protein
MTSGVARKEAKIDLCGAIADRKIGVRLTVASEVDVLRAHWQMVAEVRGLGANPKNSAPKTEYFDGVGVDVPRRLTSKNFNWQRSQPREPWPIRPRGERRDDWKLPSQPALLIEVRTADVLSWMQQTYGSAVTERRALEPDGFSDTVTRVVDSGSVAARTEELDPLSSASLPSVCGGGESNSNVEGDASTAGAKTRGIFEAIDQLWPNEIPKGLTAKERNNAIRAQLEKNGSSIPRDLPRAVQRALKARPK